jgi:hypothetical protein
MCGTGHSSNPGSCCTWCFIKHCEKRAGSVCRRILQSPGVNTWHCIYCAVLMALHCGWVCESEVIVMLAETAMCRAVSVARSYHLFHQRLCNRLKKNDRIQNVNTLIPSNTTPNTGIFKIACGFRRIECSLLGSEYNGMASLTFRNLASYI